MKILNFLLALSLVATAWSQPLTLAEAQRQALEHSHSLKRQESKVRQAGFRVDEAYSGGRPQLSFKAGTSYLTPTVSFASLPITESGNYNVGLHLDQAIHTFGRLKWGALAAELAQDASALETEKEKQDVLETVTQTYLDLIFSKRAVEVAKLQVQTRGTHLEDSKLRLKAGTIPPFEVLSFETALAQAQQRLILSSKQEELAKTRLLLMLGRQPREELEVELVEDLAVFEQTASEAVQRALAERPGLMALRKAVEAAESKVNFEKSQNNPTLGFRTSYVRQNTTAFQPNQMWVAGIQLNVPLYDGGATEAKTNQASEELVQLQETLAEAEQNVTLQVESLHLDLMTGLEQLEVAKTALVQADEHLRLAGLRYKAGVSTNLELLQAETSQAEARLAVHQSSYNVLKSYYAWRRATGLSLDATPPEPDVVGAEESTF